MKRIISCLLAVLLMVVLSYQTVAAAEDDPTFSVSSEKARPGENVSVTIRIENNPGIASVKLKVRFDSALKLNSVTYNDELGGKSQQPETFTSPVTLNWFNGDADTTGDMAYAVLDFTVKETASYGKHPISLIYAQEDVYNIAEQDVRFRIINGGVNVSYILGDVDNNGDVEIIDATWIQRYVADIDIPFTLRDQPADIDGDKEVDLPDASKIQRYLADVETKYKIGELI